MLSRSAVYKLYPDAKTEALFRQFAGVTRLVYNLALEQREPWGRSHRIGYMQQSAELKELRAAFDWIAAVSQTAQNQALRDLERAFVNFFEHRAGYPPPRRKGQNDSFRFAGREVEIERLNAKWARVRLPKLGFVKFRISRDLPGRVRNATISLRPLGWHVSFNCEVAAGSAKCSNGPAVGIDRGVAKTLAFSDFSEPATMPERLQVLDRRHRKAQRMVSRRRRGSNRWRKAMQRTAAIKAKTVRIRQHWNHERTKEIADRYGVVVLEALKIKNMIRSAKGTVEQPGRNVKAKAGLNRSIASQAWFQFETFLDDKLAERGGMLIEVDPAYTSQTCSACGVVDKSSRESQALFRCQHCGHEHDADENAALNILRRSTSWPRVEGNPIGSGEARSSVVVA